MASQQNGFTKILSGWYDTYDHWRDYCLSTGINCDWLFGNQCVDVPNFLWYQYGLTFYCGPIGLAYEIWTVSRDRNAKLPFVAMGGNASAMDRKKLIKRGDCLVFAPSGLNYTGHVAFADEDYNGTDFIKCLGQNQGQGTGWGKASNVVDNNLRVFLGAFRNTNWEKVNPDPTPLPKYVPPEHKFPWPVYLNRFRKR